MRRRGEEWNVRVYRESGEEKKGEESGKRGMLRRVEKNNTRRLSEHRGEGKR